MIADIEERGLIERGFGYTERSYEIHLTFHRRIVPDKPGTAGSCVGIEQILRDNSVITLRKVFGILHDGSEYFSYTLFCHGLAGAHFAVYYIALLKIRSRVG